MRTLGDFFGRSSSIGGIGSIRRRGTAIVSGLVLLFAGNVHANDLSGTVDAMQIYPPWNRGFIRLTGSPNFDGGGCPAPWAIGDLDDQTFMVYIWPALMSAKNNNKPVLISVSGCMNGYPKINWVQLNSN
jgi:hypothetical protein